jgi:NOL1/NOP2/sun family putative RNA methylase
MKLPVKFREKMLKLMGEEEYEQFIAALSGDRVYGLRVNTLKIGIDDFQKISPFDLEAVPWTEDGFYISGEDAPGRHPYYHAGLYYIQEPSAMLPGQILGAEPGDRVLDMCAAPGGKTVQIAAAMKGKGLLAANDINPERVKALVKNIELCGVRNAVVLNESPERLVRIFEGFFDKILIDAPCSGEGMFRKDETAARSWESFKCERCTKMQESILHYADLLLRPGGTLVYSTCTFSPEENEQMIADFMMSHKGYELVEIPKVAGIEGGRPEWARWAREGELEWARETLEAKAGRTQETREAEAGLARETRGARAGWAKETRKGEFEGTSGVDENIAGTSGYRVSEQNELRQIVLQLEAFRHAARLWPHKVRGEGHFVAKLVKKGTPEMPRRDGLHDDPGTGGRCEAGSLYFDSEKAETIRYMAGTFRESGEKVRTVPGIAGEKARTIPCIAGNIEETIPYEKLPEVFRKFVDDNMNCFPDGVFMLKGRHLYHLPEPPPLLAELKIVKFGWFLGTIEGNKFEPSHSLVTALDKEAFKRTLDLRAESTEVRSYLKGETLILKGDKGFTAVCVDGKTLGWAKQTGEMLKNLYPKGWRMMR